MKKHLIIFTTCLFLSEVVFAFGGGGGSGRKATEYKGGVQSIGVHFGGETNIPCPEHSTKVEGVCTCDTGYTPNESGFCVNNLCFNYSTTSCMPECDPLTGEGIPAENGTICANGLGQCYNGDCITCGSCQELINGDCASLCQESETCVNDSCVCDNAQGFYGTPDACASCSGDGKEIVDNQCVCTNEGEILSNNSCVCDNAQGFYGEPGNCNLCQGENMEIVDNNCVCNSTSTSYCTNRENGVCTAFACCADEVITNTTTADICTSCETEYPSQDYKRYCYYRDINGDCKTVFCCPGKVLYGEGSRGADICLAADYNVDNNGSEGTPCETNDDCTQENYYCRLYSDGSHIGNECAYQTKGSCYPISPISFQITVNDETTTLATTKLKTTKPAMSWFAANNWCEAQGLQLIDLEDLSCYRYNTTDLVHERHLAMACCASGKPCPDGWNSYWTNEGELNDEYISSGYAHSPVMIALHQAASSIFGTDYFWNAAYAGQDHPCNGGRTSVHLGEINSYEDKAQQTSLRPLCTPKKQ